MAQIGLRHFKYSPIGNDGGYTVAKKLAGAIESTASLDIAEAELYSDDELTEKAQEFTKGTLTLTVDEDSDSVFAPLLGHSKDEETGEVIKTTEDVAPFVGFGRVLVKLVNNVKKYKAEFFPKVQFKPFVTDGKSKADSIEFQTPTVEGTIFSKAETIDNKVKMVWEKHQTFDTDEEAQAYLDNLMKAPTQGGQTSGTENSNEGGEQT